MKPEQHFLIIVGGGGGRLWSPQIRKKTSPEVVDFKAYIIFHCKGHGDQRGAALGHGAPGVSDHGRDLHRAGEEGETRERGREAGAR